MVIYKIFPDKGAALMDVGQIRSLFKKMVEAVHCLHTTFKVFHQDLSIENFVLDNDNIYLIDFGQALIIQNSQDLISHDGTMFGKVSWTN
jgi:serine/threonine-protein kinase RIO1